MSNSGPALLFPTPVPTTSASLTLRPPRGFAGVCAEDIHRVYLTKNPHRGSGRHSGAQKAGLAYESKAKEWLEGQCPHVVLGQWFYYVTRRERHYCQPDAIIFDGPITERPRCITIVEMKIRWTELAWWQLTKLYAPVVEHFYQPQELRLLCLTRSFDPATVVPGPVSLLERIEEKSSTLGVFLWRP